MAGKSSIEWTESTWNPVTGCTKVSAGCQHCYAERMAYRLKAMGQRNYTHGFRVMMHPKSLSIPAGWKKPQIVFVNSMSDLFHEEVPDSFIMQVFQTMNLANWHIFQVLTKRSRRLLELSPSLPWAKHIWMGVTVEDADNMSRVADLQKTGAAVKFLSLEPLLGPLPNLNLKGIDWVIVGGESGPGARPMDVTWVTCLRDKCVKTGTPFFFKQWGGVNKKKAGRVLDGRTWNERPSVQHLHNHSDEGRTISLRHK